MRRLGKHVAAVVVFVSVCVCVFVRLWLCLFVCMVVCVCLFVCGCNCIVVGFSFDKTVERSCVCCFR